MTSSHSEGQIKRRVATEAQLFKDAVKRKMEERKSGRGRSVLPDGAGGSGAQGGQGAGGSAERSGELGGGESAGLPEGTNCVVCFEEKMTAAIIHGDDSHVCCCMKCAQKLHSSSMPCPVCRKRIDMVVKHYS